RSVPTGCFEDHFPPGACIPYLLNLEADFLPQWSLRPLRWGDESVRLEMGSRFDVQPASVFLRVVLQVKRKPYQPIAVFPMNLAAALLLPGGSVLVPAPKTVEDGERLRHEDEVLTGDRLQHTEESLVEKQPANLRIAREDVHQ